MLGLVEKGSALADRPGRRPKRSRRLRPGDRRSRSCRRSRRGSVRLFTTSTAVFRCTVKGKAIVAVLDVAAERGGVRRDDLLEHVALQVEIAISEGDMACCPGGPRRAGVGQVVPTDAAARPQPDLRIGRGRTGRGRGGARGQDVRVHGVRGALGRRGGSSRPTARRSQPGSRPFFQRLHDLAEALPCEPVVEWTVLPTRSRGPGIPTELGACRCVLCSILPVTCRGVGVEGAARRRG